MNRHQRLRKVGLPVRLTNSHLRGEKSQLALVLQSGYVITSGADNFVTLYTLTQNNSSPSIDKEKRGQANTNQENVDTHAHNCRTPLLLTYFDCVTF